MSRIILFIRGHLPELAALGGIFVFHCAAALIWVYRKCPVRAGRLRAAGAALALSLALLCLAVISSTGRFTMTVPRSLAMPLRAAGLTWAVLSTLTVLALMVLSRLPKARAAHSPSRRALLIAFRGAVIAAPTLAAGYGVFIERNALGLKEVDLAIPGLPLDLHGFRLAQITDIHMSPYLSRAELRRAVDMANEAKPNIMLVTGDLITAVGDPLDDCLAELRRLKADAGVLGCLGNHEVYARCSTYVTSEGAKAGIRFLRHGRESLRVGNANLNIAGVDYQRFHEPYLVDAEKLVREDAFNILLSHNPDVFPIAVDKGFQLTMSGHTHGGQIAVEILDQNLSVARFYTPYVYGNYRRGSGSLYVGRGIGTVGLPARFGAPPEVALVRLCAI